MKKYLIFALKMAVTALLILYLFRTRGVDIGRTWTYIRTCWAGYLVAVLALLLTGQFICSLRWSFILAALQIRIRMARLFQLYLIGHFFSLFFPSIVGGDFVKIFYIKRDSGKSLATVLASSYLDRAAGFIAILVYGMAGALIYPLALRPENFRPIGWIGLRELPLWILPAAAFVLFVAANAFLFGAHLYTMAVKVLRLLGLSRLSEKVLLIRDALQVFRERPLAMGMPLLLSFVNIAVIITANWLIALSLDIRISIVVMAAIVSVMTLMVMLPISINGIGLRENAFVILLTLVGVDPAKSLALSLIGFFLIVLSGMPGGVCYSLLKREIPLPAEGTILEEP